MLGGLDAGGQVLHRNFSAPLQRAGKTNTSRGWTFVVRRIQIDRRILALWFALGNCEVTRWVIGRGSPGQTAEGTHRETSKDAARAITTMLWVKLLHWNLQIGRAHV